MYKIAQYEYGTRCRCCNGEMLMCEPDLFPNFMQLREPEKKHRHIFLKFLLNLLRKED